MSPYYHIRIKYPISGDIQYGGGAKAHITTFYYEINLSDTEVIMISGQRQRGEDMFFDGIILFNKRIDEIKIFSTSFSYIFSKDYIKNTYREGYDFGGNEVTRMFITRPPDTPKDENPITLNREGIFFKGQQYDAFKQIRDILDTAESSITIIDGYVNNSTLDLLESKEKIKIKILTFPKSVKEIKTAGTKFNAQYHNLQIKLSDGYHDRFVIIDDKDFYHFGHTFKDLGSKGCMFSLIEEPKIIEVFRTQFNEDWSKATEVKL
jgi:hypothetical protein